MTGPHPTCIMYIRIRLHQTVSVSSQHSAISILILIRMNQWDRRMEIPAMNRMCLDQGDFISVLLASRPLCFSSCKFTRLQSD